MKSNSKFGVYRYQTENIGDDIQTLAMMRFIPRIDYVFNRDNINATEIRDKDQVKLIANGWYIHHRDGVFDWPPKNPNLQPLLISMYLERDVDSNRADLAFFTDESREFLQKFGPVGARDSGTQKFLTENGINCYFSGCLTLTLLPDKTIPKRDFILAVDVSDKVYGHISQRTERQVLRLNTNVGSDLTHEDRTIIAKYWLTLYQSAHSVITSRLHAMLPCLALGTPVLAIQKNDPHRFEGLIELVNSTSEQDFLEGRFEYDFDKPLVNPEKYSEYAEKLVKTCAEFTKYDNKESFLGRQSYGEFLASTDFIKTIINFVDGTYKAYGEILVRRELDKIIQGRDIRIAQLNAEVEELKHPGIKQSAKYLKTAISRRLRK